MSQAVRYFVLGIALLALWSFFGERLRARLDGWLAPIEQAEYTEPPGHPTSRAPDAPASSGDHASGPQPDRFTNGIRERVEGHIEQGARRSDPNR